MVRTFVNDNIDLCSKRGRSWPQEADGSSYFKKARQKLLSTKDEGSDRFSRPVRLNSLNATGGVYRTLHRTCAHTHFSRSRVTPHISSEHTTFGQVCQV